MTGAPDADRPDAGAPLPRQDRSAGILSRPRASEGTVVTQPRPVFNQINLVVRDMPAMVAFYERLGVEIAPTIEPWDRHHRNIAAEEGIDFDLDSATSPTVERGLAGRSDRSGARVRLASAEAVDATYADLTSAGYAGQQPPYDGFMGARYAW